MQQEKPYIPTAGEARDTFWSTATIVEKGMPYFWLFGAILLLIWLLFTNYSLHRKLKKRGVFASESINLIFEECKRRMVVKRNIEIIIQDVIGTPSLFDVFKPKILLSPAILNLNDKEISYILLHELAHYKRKDLLANYLLLVLQIMHWFNPVIWYCFKRIRQDMEVAADKRVLDVLESSEQKEYGNALLAVLESFNLPRLAPRLIGMIDDRKNIERRIRMIRMAELFKSKRRLFIVTGILCIVILSGVLLTNPLTKQASFVIGNYILKVPADWKVIVGEAELIFEKNNIPFGGVQIVGYEPDQPLFLPNHSETKSRKDIEGLITKAALVNLDITQPAASGDTSVKNENHLYLLFANETIAYDIYANTKYVSESQLIKIAKSFTRISNKESKELSQLVKNFGEKLQSVSLQAPKDIVKKSMQENYGNFVSQALLEKWISNPLNAPGRLTSSPWPDRIEIQSIKKISENSYEVKGEIIEITSVEKVNGGVAAKRPITLMIKKINNRWLIDDVTLGAYEETNPIVYKNTQYGFSFSLPKSWKGYSIITDKWEGFSLKNPESGTIVETGPIIYIRHPQWTSQNPRQDIPIMILTLKQWNSLQHEEFHIGAAPINPTELGHNAKYVFALPARYNYAFPTGFEEVESILKSNSFQPI